MIELNGNKITPTIFPDKTQQVWKVPEEWFESYNHVAWFYESDSELITLAQLKDLLDYKLLPADLYIDYLPYARQDKPISNETTFGLQSFCKLLNCLKFEFVEILDPHSQVATRLIDNAEIASNSAMIFNARNKTNPDILFFPDAGAKEKYGSCVIESAHGEKVRDPMTGSITKYQIVGKVKGRTVLIIDDICDGGATFVNAAQKLYESGATEVNLYVTHGLFTKGLAPLKAAGIKRIFTKKGEVNE